MIFDLSKCVNYISENITKKISEAFGRWLSDEKVTRIQWITMYFIYTNDGLSQRELSKLMNINDSSAMRIIDRLEREALIKRLRSENDRRVVNILLTQQGKELFERLLPLGAEFNSLLIKDIDQEELLIFRKVQQKMYDNIMRDNRSKK